MTTKRRRASGAVKYNAEHNEPAPFLVFNQALVLGQVVSGQGLCTEDSAAHIYQKKAKVQDSPGQVFCTEVVSILAHTIGVDDATRCD